MTAPTEEEMYLGLYLSVKGIVSLLLWDDTCCAAIIFRGRSPYGIRRGSAFTEYFYRMSKERERKRETGKELYTRGWHIYLRIVSPIESIFDEAVSLPANGSTKTQKESRPGPVSRFPVNHSGSHSVGHHLMRLSVQ